MRLNNNYPPFYRGIYYCVSLWVPVHHGLATMKAGFKAWRFYWGHVLCRGSSRLANCFKHSSSSSRWFRQRIKNHTAIHCMGVYNIMLFTDRWPVLSDWEQNVQLHKQKINMWQPMLILWWTASNKCMCGKYWYQSWCMLPDACECDKVGGAGGWMICVCCLF